MTRKTLFLILILVMVAAFLPAHMARPARAQGDGPLIMMIGGDLWSYDEPTGILRQLTQWGYNQHPVISPDGTRLAYASTAEIAIPALKQFGQTPNIPPANIWVWSLATGQAARLANQPAAATYGTGAPNETFIRRFSPAWSPDGTLLAWVESEVIGNRDNWRLVIFDVLANAIRITTPIQVLGENAILGISGPRWSAGGIALRVPLLGANNAFSEVLFVFDSGGALRGQFQLNPAATSVYDFFWVTLETQPYIGVYFAGGNWVLVNPANGTQIPSPNFPELIGSVPGGVTAYFTPRPGDGGFRWFAAANGQAVELPVTGESNQVAIARSGQAIAYVENGVFILRGGKTTLVPGTDRLLATQTGTIIWAENTWRIQTGSAVVVPAPTQPPVQPVGCALLPRVTVGIQARVTFQPPLNNALNSQPSRPSRNAGSVQLTNIPPGGTFQILNGPVCNEGIFWWQVNYNGIIGWTAEGENGVYWVEPFAAANACPPLLPPRLAISNRGRVTPGQPNAVRSQPTTNNNASAVIGSIPGGGVFNVLNGPVCADGYAWWQVSYQGVVGWTPEGEGRTYWLEPLLCNFGLPSRLVQGGRGRVTPGLPNALRTAPTRDNRISQVIGEIPAGGVFNVLSQPTCGDGYVWWQVNYNGRVGWTAEGEGGVYWLEPIP